MKKTIFLLIFVLISANLFSQNIYNDVSNDIAEKIVKEIKNKKIDKKIKIVVLNFTLTNEHSDTVRTKIGSNIAIALEKSLINNQNKDFIVIQTNTSADEMMKNGISNPTDDSDYLEKILKNITPDYYISGNYEISDNYSSLTIKNISIIPNINIKNLPNIGTPKNIIFEITDKDKLVLVNSETVKTIGDLAKIITLQLKSQTNILNVELENFVYFKNKQISEFSAILGNELEQELIRTGNYSVKRNITRGPGSRLFGGPDKTPYILSGTYRIIENENKLKINAVLKNSKTKKIIASSSVYFPLTILKDNNIKILPDLSEYAEERDEIIEKDKPKNDFDINIWTNKGNSNVIFKKDEIMQFTAYANKPCYLRFIYIIATGEAVLLLDNVEITAANAGRKYTIDKQFKCGAPYGQETLILNAKTGSKFENINYKIVKIGNINYKMITDNLDNILEKNRRGFGEIETETAEITINFLTYE